MPQSARMVAVAILLVCLAVSDAFSLATPKRAATQLSQSLADSLFDTISGSLPSFGGTDNQEKQTIVPLPPPPFQPTPEGVIQRAKLLLACDLGVQDESLLDSNFIWIGPNLGSKVLSKTDYLAAGKFFDLRSVFPDLDYRAHDFRIDENDPMTIRVTARTVGTMRGELRLRNEVLPPNGKQMRCPPETITMTFNERTGSLTKLCSGFCMDRLVGNTDGLCGVMGAATVAGKPPSDWEVYPPAQVVKRFFGRPTQQLEEPASFLAPFPETVMVQLAKGIFSANMAEADPDLLSPSFSYYTPFEGPVGKDKYLEKYASLIFDGLDPELSYLRVDPYDPYRVWVDVKPSGTTTSGVYVDGPPQAFSFTFDDEGFCTRLTASAVMDPSIGNTGGLTGIEGEKYAAGKASPGIASRPLPQALERVRKRIVSPFTKVGVDTYSLVPGAPVPIRPSSVATPVEKLKQQKPTPPVKKPAVATPPMIVPTGTKMQQPPPATPPKKQQPTLTIPKISIPAPSQPVVSDVSEAQKKAQAAVEERKKAKEAAAEEKRIARLEALEAQKQKAAQLAAEREQAARRKEAEIEEARREREMEQARRAQEAEEVRQARAIELEAAKKRQAAEQAEMAKRKAQEAEASRIARAAAAEAEKSKKAQLAAEAANRKAQAQAMAIESRRKATEAEAAEKAKAQALEAEARRKAQIANQKAQAAQRKADEIRRAQEAEENRKRQEQLAAQKEAERVRKEKEAATLQREREIAARKAEKEREAVANAERQRKEKIAAEKQAQREKLERIAAEKQAQKERKEQEAMAKKQAREAAAAAKRQRKEQLAMERQAEKERKEREAELAKQERKRKADEVAQKQLERLRRTQEAEATKKAKIAALEAERARQIAVEKRSTSSSKPASSPRPTISLFGLGRSPEPTTPESAPKEAASAPRSTFSLSSFLGRSSDSEETPTSSGPSPARQAKATTKPPRGVPVIAAWSQNRDGSITGRITGSSAFGRGEKVTTSPIRGKAVGGTVVQTSSGSKYFLESTGASASPAPAPRPSISLFGLGGDSEAGESRPSKSVPKPRPSRPVPKPRPSKSIPKPAAPSSAPRPSISLFGLGGGSEAGGESRPSKSVPKPRPSRPVPKPRPSKSIPKSAAPSSSPRATISLFGLGGGGTKEVSGSRPSKSVPRARPSKPIPKATAAQGSSPRSTISLFGLGGGGGESTSRSVPVPKAAKKAPRGVPTLTRWNKNRDGSVTGRITGSSQFEKNEKVTTSPIASGDFESGSVVKTTSGSRYFLA